MQRQSEERQSEQMQRRGKHTSEMRRNVPDFRPVEVADNEGTELICGVTGMGCERDCGWVSCRDCGRVCGRSTISSVVALVAAASVGIGQRLASRSSSTFTPGAVARAA